MKNMHLVEAKESDWEQGGEGQCFAWVHRDNKNGSLLFP